MATVYTQSQNYNLSCRLCLTNTLRLVPIFGTPDSGLSHKIFACLSIKVSEYDGLPKCICHKCECQVNIWHYFKAECEKSQKKLHEWQEYSLPSSTYVSTSGDVDEAVYIKQEPADEVMHVEHHFNDNVTFDADVQDSNIAAGQISDEAGVERFSAAENLDENNSSFNLIISGTTSVAPEESSPLDIQDTVVRDSNDILDANSSNSRSLGIEDRNTNDVVCVGTKKPERTIVEIDLDNSNDANMSMSSHSIFVNSKLETGSESTLTPSVCPERNEESYPIKKEPLDIQSPSTLPSLSADEVESERKLFKSPRKDPVIDPTTVYINSQSYDLPKIDNHLYNERTKYCKFCNKSFQNVSNLWRHIKDKHVKDNPFQCSACRKVFPGRREFVAHRVKTVSKFCRAGREPSMDTSHSSIITHHTITNGKVGRYECNECNHKFGQLKAILEHVRKHSGEKPFFCYKCNKDFRLRKSAYKHVAGCPGKVDGLTVIPKGKLKLLPKLSKTYESKSEISTSACSVSSGSDLETQVKTEEIEPDKRDDNKEIVKKKRKSTIKITQKVDLSRQELWAKNHDKYGNLNLECHICHMKFSGRKSLYCHLLKHSSKAFRCEFEQCSSLMWSLRASFEAHMLKVHGMSHNKLKEEIITDAAETSGIPEPSVSSKSKPLGKYSAVKLKCDTCFKLCSSVSSLKFHKLTHKKITCKKCEITFPASMERAHVCLPKVKVVLLSDQPIPSNQLPVLPEKRPIQYTCHLCKKKFHTKKILYQHKKMHIKMKIYKCNVCENSYSDSAALQNHKELDHPADFDVSGVKDEMKETHEEIVTQPKEESKTPDRPWKCSRCSKSYSHRVTLQRHMKLHRWRKPKKPVDPNNPDSLYCAKCDRIFESKGSFNSHQGWHSREPREVNSSESSSTPSKVDPPAAVEDTGENISCVEGKSTPLPLSLSFDSFGCDICSKRFATQRNLNIHMVYHRKVKQATVEDSSSKISAADTPEVDTQVYKCDICAQTFSDLSELSAHSNSHSVSENSTEKSDVSVEVPKPEQLHCKLCNKEYRCKKSLKYHMMGHSGEKPYKCKSCSNQYSNPNALAKHEKDRHTPILRPFSCNKCKTSFILKEDLLAHREKCTH